MKTVWFKNFPYGRFGNAAFQLLFCKYLEMLGYRIIFGHIDFEKQTELPWKLFNLSQNSEIFSTEHFLFLGEGRQLGPEASVKRINAHFDKYPNSVLCIAGYFQYDTDKIFNNPHYAQVFEDNFSLNSSRPNNFKMEIKQYYEKIDVNYLITIHVRRGDYLNHARSDNWTKEVFYTLDLDIICKAIQQYVATNRINDFAIYVATDDIDYCKAFFQDKGLRILTSGNFVGDSLIVDLAAMAKAKLLICFNSSLSILGSLINNQARVFWRQTNDKKCISFDPRSTPVLYGPVLN